MYFPTAEIEVSPLIPVLAGFTVSFFMSMGGISGAFLLLPFQMSVLGYVNPSVSATNQLYNMLSSPGGVYRYIREKRMVWPLVKVIMAGTAPGVVIGGIIRLEWLPEAVRFKLFVACVLLVIAVQVLRDLLRNGWRGERRGGLGASQAQKAPARGAAQGGCCVVVNTGDPFRIAYTYAGTEYCVHTGRLLLLSIAIGLIGGIYGIGGGAIMSPFLVSFLCLPVHTIAGATLLSTCLTAIIGVVFFLAASPFYPDLIVVPDWRLALLFGLGGMAGMYCGARVQKYVSDRLIKWMLLLVLGATAFSYFREAFC